MVSSSRNRVTPLRLLQIWILNCHAAEFPAVLPRASSTACV